MICNVSSNLNDQCSTYLDEVNIYIYYVISHVGFFHFILKLSNDDNYEILNIIYLIKGSKINQLFFSVIIH